MQAQIQALLAEKAVARGIRGGKPPRWQNLKSSIVHCRRLQDSSRHANYILLRRENREGEDTP